MPVWLLTQDTAWELWPGGLCCLARLLSPPFPETSQAPFLTLHLS